MTKDDDAPLPPNDLNPQCCVPLAHEKTACPLEARRLVQT